MRNKSILYIRVESFDQEQRKPNYRSATSATSIIFIMVAWFDLSTRELLLRHDDHDRNFLSLVVSAISRTPWCCNAITLMQVLQRQVACLVVATPSEKYFHSYQLWYSPLDVRDWGLPNANPMRTIPPMTLLVAGDCFHMWPPSRVVYE